MNINEIINKHQKTAPQFNFEKKDRPFKKLEELYKEDSEKSWELLAVFINKKSKFGDHGVFITDDYQVSLPQHLTEMCESMREDDDMISAINQGDICFKVYQYTSDNGREGYSVNLVPKDLPF